jgi:tRNA nucleotidyltransferase/poly(A) polymerase
MRDLKGKIIKESMVSRVLDAGGDVFLVGGYIRDLVRGSRSKEIDFVARGDIRKLASFVFPDSATIIEFKGASLVRAVTGDCTVDITELKGDIEDDLRRRDFTMNAIAWSAKEGIIDPLRGIDDIRRQSIRGIAEGNFVDDPLRLLRAYRFAGELGWKIEEGTRVLIRKLARSVRSSSFERITSEMFRLLDSRHFLRALKMARKDGLAGHILDLRDDKMSDNIRELSLLNLFIAKMHGRSSFRFDETFSQGLSYSGLLKAEQLLHGSVMEKNCLSLSSAILKRATVADRFLDAYEKNRRMNRAKIFEFFVGAREGAFDLALLTRRRRLVEDAQRFLGMMNIVTTARIMDITGLNGGPELGSLLKELKRMQFLGRISDEESAVEWLQNRQRGNRNS